MAAINSLYVCVCVGVCGKSRYARVLGHNKSGLGQPQPTTHSAQSTADWHTHTHTHIPQASKSLLALKSNAFPHSAQFQISKFDFTFSMAITVYAVPQQQISLAICGQNCHLPVSQSANKLGPNRASENCLPFSLPFPYPPFLFHPSFPI